MIHSLLLLCFPLNRMPQEYCSTVVVCLKNMLDLDLYDSDKSRSNIIVFAQYLFRQNSHWLQPEFCLTKHCGILPLVSKIFDLFLALWKRSRSKLYVLSLTAPLWLYHRRLKSWQNILSPDIKPSSLSEYLITNKQLFSYLLHLK